MQILDQAATRAALPYTALLDALDVGFGRAYTAPLRHHHHMTNADAPDDVLLLMPAWLEQGWGGVKLVNVTPGNAERGLPAVAASYVLFDRRTGAHELLLDGGELTARRTAAASALAARRLARPDSETHLIIGAGRVGGELPYAYREALQIKRTLVHSRSVESARRLVSRLTADGFAAEVAEDPAEAAARADVISCATLATEPVLPGAWLRSGQHVDLIGSFTPSMREVDDEAIRRASVFVDTEAALVESGDIAAPLASGALQREDLAGTLADLCAKDLRPRKSDDEITLFKGVGAAIEDLSAAMLARELAEGAADKA